MGTNAARSAKHRKAIILGISVSAAAHVAALGVITLPGGDATGGQHTTTITDHTFEAISLIEIEEAAPSVASVPRTTRLTTESAAAGQSSLAELMASFSAARPSTNVPSASRPIVTFAGLEPVSQDAAVMAALAGFSDGSDDEEEQNGGAWNGFLTGLGNALSGGGHCPTPVGAPFVLVN